MPAREYRLRSLAQPFRLVAERGSDATVVRLLGEFDVSSKKEFQAQLRELVRLRPNRVVIDLGGLTFVDSVGLSMILEAESQSRRDGFELVFVTGRGQVRRVLEQTGIAATLSFVESS